MAKEKKGVDGVDKVISLFPAGSHKMIERLLARAAQRDATAAGRNVKKALQGITRGNRVENKLAGNLAEELGRALRHRSDVGSNKTSIRQKSPESGGRSFHFAHSVIHKGEAAPAASGKAGAGKAGAGKSGRAAAHMRYIEREIAVERTYGQGLQNFARAEERKGDGRDVDGPGVEPGAARGIDEAVQASRAGAGQGYIENPVKLANGEQIIFSFGTIGDQFEDRVRFWEALEEAEAHPDARVQHRLIVELPHEASAQARFEMVKVFAQRFEKDRIPYWAALHAPGKDNDSRNYHAHIVYSERPARRMTDPEEPEKGERWDFEILKSYRKKSRNLVTTRPYKQEKLRTYHARDFIPTIRKEFSGVVNAVLERDEVKDKGGSAVRYDARSYKDMGVDAVPMRSINRIVADKLKGGKMTVLDGDYTKRMITAELREAAAKRQKDVMELIALDNVLRATADTSRPQSMNGKLPKELRISPWANPTKAAMKVASRKILEAKHAALQIDVMERATTASLERVIAATSIKAVAAAAKARDPIMNGEAPSADGASLLHAAALDELEATRASTAEARRSIAYKIGNAVNEWRELVGAQPPQISPAVKAAIRQMDRQEEAAEREARAPNVPSAAQTKTSDAAQRAEDPVIVRRPEAAEPKAAAAETTADTAKWGERRDAGERGTGAISQPKPAVEATGASSKAPEAAAATVTPLKSTPRHSTPMTMEERLKIAMPPTNADLDAASKMVSGWIRSAAEDEPDPNKRIGHVLTMIKELSRAGLERREELTRTIDGVRGPDTEKKAEAEKTPVDAAPAAVAERRQGSERAGANGEASSTAEKTTTSKAVAAAGSSPLGRESSLVVAKVNRAGKGPGQSDLFNENAKPEATIDGDAVKVVTEAEGDAVKPKEGSKNQTPTETFGSRPSDEADDARRRKKREEEEKRKRKRQAVLGRKNRGRSR